MHPEANVSTRARERAVQLDADLRCLRDLRVLRPLYEWQTVSEYEQQIEDLVEQLL